MFQVSGQYIENFSRNSYFQVGGLHVSVRVLILVCAINRLVLQWLLLPTPKMCIQTRMSDVAQKARTVAFSSPFC